MLPARFTSPASAGDATLVPPITINPAASRTLSPLHDRFFRRPIGNDRCACASTHLLFSPAHSSPRLPQPELSQWALSLPDESNQARSWPAKVSNDREVTSRSESASRLCEGDVTCSGTRGWPKMSPQVVDWDVRNRPPEKDKGRRTRRLAASSSAPKTAPADVAP